MKYNFDNMTISSMRVDTQNELKHILSTNKYSFSISDNEYATKYTLLKVRIDCKAHVVIYCGLFYGGYTPFEPMVINHPNNNHIWLAMDSAVYIVSFDKLKVIKEISVPLYWDVVIGNKYPLIVVHEQGATALGNDGNIMWSVEGKDKLNHFEVDNGNIKLTFGNGDTKIHDI